MSAYMERIKAQMQPLYEAVQELDGLDTLTDAQKGDYDRMIAQLGEHKAEYDKAVERATKASAAGDMIAGLQAPPQRPRILSNGSNQESKAGGQHSDKPYSAVIADSFSYKSQGEIRHGDSFDLPGDFLQRILETKAAWVPGNLGAAGGPIQIFGPNTPRVGHPLLDLIPTTPWGNFAVPYLAPVFTNNAAVVAMGQPKPESLNAGNVQSALMQTIATWKDVPRQLLRYIAGIRQVLDDELIGAVLAKLEDEVLNGDGTAGHFNGLYQQVTQAGTGADMVIALLNGIGKVQAQGGTPTGIVMNPSDYWALVSHAYTNNKYSPITANGRFAGIPVAAVTSNAAGKAIVGDFTSGLRLYDGESANVRATEGPGAKSNIVTLIAEVDAVLVVGKPNYFAEVTAPLPT